MSRPRSPTQQSLPSIRSILPEQFNSQHHALQHNVRSAGVPALTQPRVMYHTLDAQQGRSALSQSDLGGKHHSSRDRPYDRRHSDAPLNLGANVSQASGPSFGVLRPRSSTDPAVYISSNPALPTSARLPSQGHPEVAYGESTRWIMNSSTRGLSDKKHECPYCLKCFNRPSSLAIHINSHTGAKPFVCPVCGRLFSVNSNMRRHYRNHGSTTAPGASLQTAGVRGAPYTASPFSTSPLPPFPTHTPSCTPYTTLSDSDCDEPSDAGSENSPGHSGGDTVDEANASLARFRLSLNMDDAARHEIGNSRSSPCNVPGCRCGQPATALRPAIYEEHRARER